MEKLSDLLRLQLSETESIIYLLVDSGMSSRDISKRIGMSYTWVCNVYDAAKEKVRKMETAGLLRASPKRHDL